MSELRVNRIQSQTTAPVEVLPGIAYRSLGAAAILQSIHSKLQEEVSVKDFGAIGDGIADDTQAIINGLAHLASTGGGTLFFPSGSYRTTQMIDIPSSSIRLLGTGTRKVYPGLFAPTNSGPSTIFGVHAGRCLFRVFNQTLNSRTTISAEHINFATLETGLVPQCAWGFAADQFHRDFYFYRCGVHGFQSAFDLYVEVASVHMAMALLHIEKCVINRNRNIARTLNGTNWTCFYFIANESGQNGYNAPDAGITISAHSAFIRDNLLEGQRNPVTLTGMRVADVSGNYFEGNVGSHNISINGSMGPVNVTRNYREACATTFHFIAVNSGNVTTDGPVFPQRMYLGSPPVHTASGPLYNLGTNIDAIDLTRRWTRIDRVVDAAPFIGTAQLAGATVTNTRDINPYTGLAMSCETLVPGGTLATNWHRFQHAVAFPAGSWVVLTFLWKTNVGVQGVPYITWSVGLDGPQDTTFAAWPIFRQNDTWYVVSVAYRAATARPASPANLVDFYPLGTDAAAGVGTSVVAAPTIAVYSTLADVKPALSARHFNTVAAIPTAGTWVVGDRLFNSAPAAGASGWVCTVSGTPGTWVAF